MRQERICQQGKQDLGFFLLMEDAFFFFPFFMEVVGKPQSPWICFLVATAKGLLLSAEEARVQGCCRGGGPESGDPHKWAQREGGHKGPPFLQRGWRAALPAEQM